MKKMKLPSPTSIILNGAALLIAAASAVVVVRSVFFEDSVAPCRERYPFGTRFSLDRDGEPLDSSSLQARLGNTDWNLVKSAAVVRLKRGPARHVLEIDLASAPSVEAVLSGVRAGVGFTWSPQGLGRKSAACLAYSVFIPEVFSFGKGGRLPGLMGAPATDSAEPVPPTLSVRYAWRASGEIEVFAQVPGWSDGRALNSSRFPHSLARGRWVSLEQEVVLNAPGAKDGTVRVWVDGALAFNRSDVALRTRPEELIDGVLAEMVAGEPEPGQRRGSQKIWLSPFELRWNEPVRADAP